jgi:hypothetical protein
MNISSDYMFRGLVPSYDVFFPLRACAIFYLIMSKMTGEFDSIGFEVKPTTLLNG